MWRVIHCGYRLRNAYTDSGDVSLPELNVYGSYIPKRGLTVIQHE